MVLPAFRQRPTLWALLFVTLSFLGWGTWTLASRHKPVFGGLSGHFADQQSHLNAGRLLVSGCGFCLWKQPVDQILKRYTPEQHQQLGDDLRPYVVPGFDIFVMPGWPLNKPLLLGWPHLPRPYPPGAIVLAAPAALAYHFLPLSYSGATRLTNLLYVLYAHIGFFFLLRGFLSGSAQPLAFGLLGALLLYSESVHWAIEGFYDVALLAPIALCGHFLLQRRGLAALVAYCAAAFIHYRAFFFAPLALYALYLTYEDWRQRRWGARQWIAVGAIAVLGGLSLYTFWLLSPWLSKFPLTNALRRPGGPAMKHLLLVGALAAAALIYARAWMDVVLMGWMAWMTSRIYQTQAWHGVSLMIWMVLPVWTSRMERIPIVRDVRLAFVWVVTSIAFGQILLPAYWVEWL